MTTFDITQTANPAQSKKVLFDVQHAVAIITLNDPTSHIAQRFAQRHDCRIICRAGQSPV